ncbi:unnamed protein product [Closterium sp. NIES-53]
MSGLGGANGGVAVDDADVALDDVALDDVAVGDVVLVADITSSSNLELIAAGSDAEKEGSAEDSVDGTADGSADGLADGSADGSASGSASGSADSCLEWLSCLSKMASAAAVLPALPCASMTMW